MPERTLEDFFDAVRLSQRANRELFPGWYAIIARIDGCLVRAGSNLINPEPLTAAVLLLRCQYALKAAASMALAGQAGDVFPTLRSVLEYAGYCLVIYETPSLAGVFSLRHAGKVEMDKQKRAFKIKAVKGAVARHSARSRRDLRRPLPADDRFRGASKSACRFQHNLVGGRGSNYAPRHHQ